MTDPDLLPAGLADRLPPEAEIASSVRRAMLDTLKAHGYRRVAPPLVEFERSLASRALRVERERLVRFVDPVSLEMLAIRSDITVQVGRLAATRLAAAPRPLRLSYAGAVLSLRASDLEPARERLQIGGELIGSDSVAAASEIVAIALAGARAAGATGLSIDFTLPDLVDALAGTFPLPDDRVEAVRRELDMKDAGALAALGAGAYLPLLTATGPLPDALERLRGIDAGGALASRIRGIAAIADAQPGDVTMTLDPTERHGFEYQSWFGFTLHADGVRGPLARGGTYAIRAADGSPEPATGFSLYPDGLIDRLAEEPPRDSLRLFMPLGHDPADAARMRAIGWRTVAALDENCDPAELGCSHRFAGDGPVPL